MQLAVWSGPRNISTALMYSFAQRKDFVAIDEPFYASYLSLTGLNHPMRDEVIASQPIDPKIVIQRLIDPPRHGPKHMYQKHMTQHMIDAIPRDWIKTVTNVFLIRHPARVIASFSKKYENPTIHDIGFQKQTELFCFLRNAGQNPLVINSYDIRRSPEKMLKKLCLTLSLDFDPAMLCWDAGGSPYDGIWAQHWYGAVHASTGFSDPEGPLPQLPQALRRLEQESLRDYEEMMDYCL